MSVLSNSEFAERMQQLAKDFTPGAYYDPDGDCIEFIAKPDSFHAERIDDLVTVYYSNESDEVIGALVKGASKFVDSLTEKMPGFRIEIRDGKVSLSVRMLSPMPCWRKGRSDGEVVRCQVG